MINKRRLRKINTAGLWIYCNKGNTEANAIMFYQSSRVTIQHRIFGVNRFVLCMPRRQCLHRDIHHNIYRYVQHYGSWGVFLWINHWHSIFICMCMKTRFDLRLMTSSNGNIFRVTGRLCGYSPVTGEFPVQRPVTEPWSFLWSVPG